MSPFASFPISSPSCTPPSPCSSALYHTDAIAERLRAFLAASSDALRTGANVASDEQATSPPSKEEAPFVLVHVDRDCFQVR